MEIMIKPDNVNEYNLVFSFPMEFNVIENLKGWALKFSAQKLQDKLEQYKLFQACFQLSLIICGLLKN